MDLSDKNSISKAHICFLRVWTFSLQNFNFKSVCVGRLKTGLPCKVSSLVVFSVTVTFYRLPASLVFYLSLFALISFVVLALGLTAGFLFAATLLY